MSDKSVCKTCGGKKVIPYDTQKNLIMDCPKCNNTGKIYETPVEPSTGLSVEEKYSIKESGSLTDPDTYAYKEIERIIEIKVRNAKIEVLEEVEKKLRNTEFEDDRDFMRIMNLFKTLKEGLK